MKAKIGFIVLAVSTVVSGDSKLDEEAPLSVCGLLEHRLQYNGKMVHVRGIVEGSPEGAALIGTRCAKAIVTDGFTWPNAIALAYHTDYNSPYTVDFTRDQDQIDRTNRELKRIRHKNPNAKILVTYVGLFETRTNLGQAVNLAGELIPAGFGHLNACPARLVIQTKKNARVLSVK
jgi:hypothetical protein